MAKIISYVSTSDESAVQLNWHFQKSVRIDSDLQIPNVLDGYVSQESCLNLLQMMSRAIYEQRNSAFTWTGPYGSGKSFLALVLSALLSSSPKLRSKAIELLRLNGSDNDFVSKVFCGYKKWTVIDLVGTDRPLRDVLQETLVYHHLAEKDQDPLQVLREHSDECSGIAIIIDEMGTFLLNAMHHNGMMFIQELAETVARSNGSIVLIGILHQSFDAYVSGLSKEVRDEWAKVQGRFDNYVFAPSVFETIALLSESMQHQKDHAGTLPDGTEQLMHYVFRQSPELEQTLLNRLQRCLPLHPVTVLLLCALTRRSYGQNERSIFSFLGSLEPYALQDYVRKAGYDALYTPARLFDYIRANVSSMLMQSSDLHKWELAIDCVNTAERNLQKEDIDILKTIAITEIYGKYSGLEVTKELLHCVIPAYKSIERLLDSKLILYKSYAGIYSLFAGSLDANISFRKLLFIGDTENGILLRVQK